MSIVLYRIDDRLVHGQVMVAWSKIYQTTRIFVVDDETACDQFLCDVMKMAVPSDYDARIFNVQQAIERIKADPPDKKTMVLAKTPKTMLALLEGGVDIKELNVGNIGAGPGRKAVMRNIQLSQEEYATLQKIQDAGVRVYLQIFPDAKALNLDKVSL